MEWPSNSSDLNPIENVLGIYKRTIGKDNKNDLFTNMVRIWSGIDSEYLHTLFDSMPSRINAEYNANGDVTRY